MLIFNLPLTVGYIHLVAKCGYTHLLNVERVYKTINQQKLIFRKS